MANPACLPAKGAGVAHSELEGLFFKGSDGNDGPKTVPTTCAESFPQGLSGQVGNKRNDPD